MAHTEYTYDYLIQAFQQAKATAENLTSDLDEEVFLRRPAKDKWCIGEILSHLVQTGREYLPQIKKGLNKPDFELKKGADPFIPGFLFRWFIHQVSPENKKKLPTVKSFQPEQTTSIDRHKVLQDFLQLQNEFIIILKKSKLEGLDLGRIKTRNPVIKFVPMSLIACFGITEAHQRRHFEQMRDLKKRFSK
ncbi:MAG: DinB family protein [Gracilimonas sp.]|uniref:DinB family protein n=1 Tax=Gracilimonas sp. TaxID=1974203 RepID=UPI001987B96B|nr:DinB family protein [Gracilimonas sp.]MBD3616481.1 DinB family protein [Gracilimonas sp.]